MMQSEVDDWAESECLKAEESHAAEEAIDIEEADEGDKSLNDVANLNALVDGSTQN